MTITNEQFKELSNYDKLLTTARMFAPSQGYYGRLLANLQELDEDSILDLDEIEELTNASNTLDVVMFLEG
jgi:hypothetical protein